MTSIVTVSASTLRKACDLILGCEHCSLDAEVPFDWLLDEVTGQKPARIDYLLPEFAKCPSCGREISEKTLVEW